MLIPSVLFVTFVAATSPATAPDAAAIPVRQDRPIALWLEPELLLGSQGGVLPLGLELGGQIFRRGFLSLALARLPAPNVERNEIMLAGRFYLGDQAWAPYLLATAGWMRAGIDDTGGESETHRFATLGLGAELALRNGFSLTGDLTFGPDLVIDPFGDETRHLAAWLRLGLGYRL